jgi:hypothetical protein
VALFTLLLFLKSFHWLAEDRVDFMERSPTISFLFHLRVISLAALLAIVDINFILHAYHSTLTKGASVQLVFGFEYAVLLTIVANTLVKYVLHRYVSKNHYTYSLAAPLRVLTKKNKKKISKKNFKKNNLNFFF